MRARNIVDPARDASHDTTSGSRFIGVRFHVIGYISNSQEGHLRLMRASTVSDEIENSHRGSIADDVRLKDVFPVSSDQSVKRQMIQGTVRNDDQPAQLQITWHSIEKQAVECFCFLSSAIGCQYIRQVMRRQLVDFLLARRETNNRRVIPSDNQAIRGGLIKDVFENRFVR